MLITYINHFFIAVKTQKDRTFAFVHMDWWVIQSKQVVSNPVIVSRILIVLPQLLVLIIGVKIHVIH